MAAFVSRLCDELPYVDLVVNNAAVCPKGGEDVLECGRAKRDVWQRVLQVNLGAALTIMEGLEGLLRRSPRSPRVVNVSSGDGELVFYRTDVRQRLERLAGCASARQVVEGVTEEAERLATGSGGVGVEDAVWGGQAAYRMSKTGLNLVTRVAARNWGGGIEAVAVCPGDIDTGMADKGAVGVLTASEAAQAMWAVCDVEVAVGGGRNGRLTRFGEVVGT